MLLQFRSPEEQEIAEKFSLQLETKRKTLQHEDAINISPTSIRVDKLHSSLTIMHLDNSTSVTCVYTYLTLDSTRTVARWAVWTWCIYFIY